MLLIFGALFAGFLHADLGAKLDPASMEDQPNLRLSDSSADNAISFSSLSGALGNIQGLGKSALAAIKGGGAKALAMMKVAGDIASEMGEGTLQAFDRLSNVVEKMESLKDLETFFKVAYAQGFGKAFDIIEGASGMTGIKAAEKGGTLGAGAAKAANDLASAIKGIF